MSQAAVSSQQADGRRLGTDDQHVPIRPPIWFDVGLTAGLGLAVYVGPTIYVAMRESTHVWWPRICKSVKSLAMRLQRRLEPMNRRRRNGSIIRVIADLLPRSFYGPTPRIFITGINPGKGGSRLSHALNTSSVYTMLGTSSPLHDTNNAQHSPIESGGVIVAFELDKESEYEETFDGSDDADQYEEDVSSNPEGWEPFQPGAHSTIFKYRSGTPTQSLPDSEITDYCDNIRTQEEINSLKQTVQMLVHQLSVLNQNMTVQSQTAHDFRGHDVDETLPLPPPPDDNVTTSTPQKLPLVPTLGTSSSSVSNMCATGPPPPPPPPMPLMVFQGSAPIKLTKSTVKQSVEVQKAPSMMDVLKDLNKVKLKSVERSPGGTPVKDRNRLNDKNSLEYALKKRFERMQDSPTGSDDENCSEDKENEFEDSFLKNVESPRSRKTNRRSGTAKSRNLFTGRKSDSKPNQLPPFGPHLLKSIRN